MKFILEKCKAYSSFALVTLPNRYMGIVLFLQKDLLFSLALAKDLLLKIKKIIKKKKIFFIKN